MFNDIVKQEKPKQGDNYKCDFHGIHVDKVTCKSFHYSTKSGCKHYRNWTRDCALKQSGITP